MSRDVPVFNSLTSSVLLAFIRHTLGGDAGDGELHPQRVVRGSREDELIPQTRTFDKRTERKQICF